MVSHAQVAQSSYNRAPSVSSSRPSHSRRHHHHRGRSHHGGSTHAPRNEFPFFEQTGDVEIVIACDGQEKRYLLHSLILAQFSGFFQAGMSDEWSRFPHVNVPSSSRPDQALTIIGEEPEVAHTSPFITPDQINQTSPSRQRWRYELDWANLGQDDEPILVQKTPSLGGLFTPSLQPPPPPVQHRPKPPNSTSFLSRSMANLSLTSHHNHLPSQSSSQLGVTDPALSNPVLRDYDNLFLIFYNYSPSLNSTNIASAYAECKSLLSIADMYDALEVVGPRIDHHLLRFSSRLFKQIAKYPPSYLKLGYLARSRIIFSEALTHVVGQWPMGLPYLKPRDQVSPSGYEIPQSVIDLIEDKVDELEELKSRIEAKLFRLTLTTSRGERVNPSNDYLGWLAMSLWRQWLAENTTPEVRGILKNSPAPNNNNNTGSRPGSGNANTTALQGGRNSSRPPSHPQTHPAAQAPAIPSIQPNPSRIYRLIASPDSQSFLSHDELKRFLKIQPNVASSSVSNTASSTPQCLYTRETLKKFERKMDEIKNVARDIVKPLTRNCLELEVRSLMGDSNSNGGGGSGGGGGGRGGSGSGGGGGGGLGYLTCMRVEEGELPWD